MFRRFTINFALFSIFLDAGLISLGLYFSAHIRPYLSFIDFAAHYPDFVPVPSILYPIFILQWIIILLLFSVYDGRRNMRLFDEFISLTTSSVIATAAMAGTLFLSYREVSRLLFITFVLVTYTGMLTWRIVSRMWYQHLNEDPRRLSKVLIIGTGSAACAIQEQIEDYPQLPLKVIGFLDNSAIRGPNHADLLGPISAARAVIEEHHVEHAVIALPQHEYKVLNQLVAELHTLPVKVWVIPDYFRLALHKAAVDEFAGIPMFDLRAPALNDYQRLVKRAFDLIISLLILPLALPVMGIIALIILIESGAPVIFDQLRAGENGRTFRMYKFRTMQVGAEMERRFVEKHDEQGRMIHKTPNDPRVTKFGRFLRRRSLDELPQLFNVIRGDMSLIGPRPELPYLVAQYEPWQWQRFTVPQGVTGWWQINGRSDKPMHLHTEDDLYYVHNYSLVLDIQILIKTLGVVIHGNGAF